MAYRWGDGQLGNRPKQNNRNNFNHSNPHLRLRNYEGPYDYTALTRARDELCCYIERMQDTAAWHKIQRKTDVNIYDFRDLNDGFGESSTVFSHAGLPGNQTDEETFQETYSKISVESPFSLPEKSTDSAEQGTSATVTNEDEESEVDYSSGVRGSNEDNSSGSDCLILGETVQPVGNYNLELDGIEVVPSNEHSDKVVVIEEEEDSSENSPVKHQADTGNLNHIEDGGGGLNTNIGLDNAGGSLPTFKCDFCDYISDAKTNMQEHLNKAVHLAASEYTLDETERMKLKRSMVLMNLKAQFKTVLVVCPDSSCFKVFPNIHMCIEHYNLKHVRNKNERNQYGLISIVKEEDCINAVSPKQCHVCFKQLDSRSRLNKHFKAFGHYPFSEVKSCQKMFFCFYCKSNFVTFESITSHQEGAHKKAIQNGALQFTVFHYEKAETHRLFLEEEITSTSDTTPTVESGLKQGTSNREPVGSSTESGSSVGTSKRKHDGSFEEFEPRIKITVNNEYAGRRSDKNENSILAGTADGDEPDSLPGTSFTMSKGIDSDEDTSTNQENLTEILKCDYCLKTTKDQNQMYLHLVSDFHSSASTVLIDQQENIVYLKETRTVKLEDARYKNVAAACQFCHLLFDTIFMCEDHNVRSHKDRCYHLVDIVDRVMVKVAVSKNVCPSCGKRFDKNVDLNNHCLQANHFPFKERNDCNIFVLCRYCKKTFPSYRYASGHVKVHQNMAKNGMLDLIILYVSKNSREYTLPPFRLNREAEITSINSKIENLNKFKKNCGKRGKLDIRKEIRDLKKLI